MERRVVIIEDERDVARLLEFNLRSAGFEVTSAATGGAGITEVARVKPDVVVLDLMLPDQSGYEVCKQIRADPDPSIAATKIVVISVKGYATDIKTAKEVGANHYLVKPHSVRELMTVVERELGPAPR